MSASLFKQDHIATLAALAGITLALSLLDLFGIPALDILAFPVFLVSTVLVCLTSWLVVNATSHTDPLDLRLLDAGLVSLSVIAGLGLLLGTGGWLSFRSLALWIAVVAVGAAGWLRYGSSRPSLLPNSGEDREAVPRTGTPVGGTGMLPGIASDDPTGGSHRWLASPGGTPLPVIVRTTAALITGLVAFGVVQAVLGRVLRPPVGDPLAYHLPFAVEWLQRGSLAMPVPAAGDPSTPFYPLNSSLWVFWTLAPFESEILARYVQLPFLALLGLAAFRLGLEIDLSRTAALVAAALAVTVPDIARSASLPENDLILAALLVTATAYLARLWQRPTRWRSAMGALALGLAAGTKVLALPFAGLLGIAWLCIVIARWRGEGGRAVVAALATGAGLVLVFGSYSYVRNTVVMGNPLYPSGYVVGGRELFEGLYVMTWEWRRTHAFFPFDWSGFFFDMRRSFGWMVTWWTLPGLGLAALGLVRELGIRDGARARGSLAQRALLLLWVPLTLLIFWFIIPYHFSRFLFSTVVWGIVLSAWGFTWLLRIAEERLAPLNGTLPLLALPFIASSVLNMPLDPTIRGTALYWFAAIVVVGGVAGTWLVLPHLKRLARPVATREERTVALAAVVMAIAMIIVWPFYEREYEDRRFDEWRLQIQSFSELTDAWEWVDRRTGDEPAVIAVAGTNEVYPLYGSGLDNRVVTIWHSGELAGYDWGSPFRLYGEPDREAWLRRIADIGVDYVYLTEDVSFGGWPVERDWMSADASRFELAYANEDVEIWAVRSGRLTGYTHASGSSRLPG